MESLRDVRRVMEREAKKGSCPLMFDRLEFGGKPFQSITSEEKLDEALAYLLRLRSFRQYAEKTIINNVYMDLDILCKKPQFKRTHSVIDREGIYARVQRYKKRLQPDYESGLCLETVRCIFTLPEGEAEKCRMTHDGQETYAFIMSNKLSSACLPIVKRQGNPLFRMGWNTDTLRRRSRGLCCLTVWAMCCSRHYCLMMWGIWAMSCLRTCTQSTA